MQQAASCGIEDVGFAGISASRVVFVRGANDCVVSVYGYRITKLVVGTGAVGVGIIVCLNRSQVRQ